MCIAVLQLDAFNLLMDALNVQYPTASAMTTKCVCVCVSVCLCVCLCVLVLVRLFVCVYIYVGEWVCFVVGWLLGWAGGLAWVSSG